MKSLKFVSILLLSVMFLGSCAYESPIEDNSNPVGDIEEGFMTQEPRTYHENKYRPNEFFFKQCEQQFDETFYSRTSYFCNER